MLTAIVSLDEHAHVYQLFVVRIIILSLSK